MAELSTKQAQSEIFKSFQANIKKKDSFDIGKQNLLALRAELSAIYDYIFSVCSKDDFCKMPIASSKSIAYYVYHLIRIEDITSNTLIAGKEELFFSEKFGSLLNSPIITTGNELARDDLIEFSKALDINQLKNYVSAVYANTNVIIQNMSFEDSKTKISAERKAELIKLNTVSADQMWLVDYWCNKTYAGLLLMPLSRHQMMHLDGCLRILKKINK